MFSIFQKLRDRKNDNEEAAEYLEEGGRLAEEAINRQMAELAFLATTDNEILGPYVDGIGDLAGEMFAFEMPFLWGFFHEYVQTKDFATNGYSRILIHLIHHLTKKRGFSLSEARELALKIDRRFNADEVHFMALADIGKEAFHDPDDNTGMASMFILYSQGMKDVIKE